MIPALVTAQAKGDFKTSIALLQNWLETAQPGDPENLIAACPTDYQPKLILLLRDLLSRYPTTLMGAPVLIYLSDEADAPYPSEPDTALWLPYPNAENCQPCHGLRFLGWLPANTRLPVEYPFRPEWHHVQATKHEIFAAVALFRCRPNIEDFDKITFPVTWWGELFRNIPADIELSPSEMLFAYPDALEAAKLLAASARGEPLPARTGFLTDTGRAWATDAGALFYENCRHRLAGLLRNDTHSFSSDI